MRSKSGGRFNFFHKLLRLNFLSASPNDAASPDTASSLAMGLPRRHLPLAATPPPRRRPRIDRLRGCRLASPSPSPAVLPPHSLDLPQEAAWRRKASHGEEGSLEAEEEESLVPVGGRRRRGRRPKGQGPAASVEAFLLQHNGGGSSSTTARSPAARGGPAADGPGRLCSASSASPPTSPRSRHHATAPRLAPTPARACASCSCIAVLNNGPDRLRAELQRRVEQRSTTSSNGCSKRPAVGSQIHKIRARLHEGEQQPLPHAEPDPDCSAATTSPSS